MGRFGTPQLGYLRDSEENDIPELNQCPSCGAFFEGDICPVCKTPCPEEMKAGNRKPPPKKRKKREKSYVRGLPPPLYQQTWFIIVVLFISKLFGILLVWMSEWKKWVKVTVTILAVFGGSLYIVLFSLLRGLLYREPAYVNVSLPESSYREQCSDSIYEELVRYPDRFPDFYVTEELTVLKVAEGYGGKEEYGDFILCADADGSRYALLDCRRDGAGMMEGDRIRIFGQFAYVGALPALQDNLKYPLIYTAYIDVLPAEAESQTDRRTE